ncbi:recombinase family protein [Phreatobacter stygius]|uniref:Recombinase family protein n=1 Tax=Phreatobacter stygius TaxID=1940610 RepID=A0A4D7B939_9HYPH|nr:recombinase family protein [Phreatobacter stygius]QCI64582.1 recombinase family protein [Phreatobacter stygius]
MAIVGYARTSTKDQVAGLEDQVDALRATGCKKIFQEHGSGIDAVRPELMKALDYVREGDVFTVTKPDRLARSVPDLLQIVGGLRERGVEVRILSMALDTSTPTGTLMLTVLGGVAAFERELMLERQRAGIARAKSENKYRGRAATARAKSAEVLCLHKEGRKPASIARDLNIGRASVYRILSAALP